MIVIPTSASYTMEGRILSMPFTTLTESGLEMMFCLTSGHSSFSRDKKSGCSRLMINIVILKRPHTNHIGSFEILVLTSSLTSPDDVAMLHTTRNVVAIACLKHLMTESFTIPKLPTSDFVSSVASWVMALHCHVFGFLSYLFCLIITFSLFQREMLLSYCKVFVCESS